MMRKLMISVVAIVSTAAGLIAARAGDSPITLARGLSSQGCASLPSFARGAPGLASGRGLWAVAGGGLVSPGLGRAVTDERLVSMDAARAAASSTGTGTIQHLAVRRGVGTAYVIDRAGTDLLVEVTRRGVAQVDRATQVLHPAWSARGRLAWSRGSSVLVRDPVSDEITELAVPIEGATVFAPVFLSDRRIVAVVSELSHDGTHDAERLGNLWATGLSRPRWRMLTHFRAAGDRWIAIRTPIARAGGIDFVRVTGSSSSTGEPRFELWRYEHGAASRVKVLDGERYLAGRLGGELVWNRPDPRYARHVLEVEHVGGMRTIGCGAVLVDPIDVIDPDRRGRGSLVPPRRYRPELEAASVTGGEEVAVIVGDFPTVGEAEAVAARIRAEYPTSDVDVVDNGDSPLAIRPGVFGALLHLPQDADPTGALAAFRAALPEYAPNSWIVTP